MTAATRRRKKFQDSCLRAMDLARREDVVGAITLFTSEVGQSRPFDFLLLHAAAAVSLDEFEKCLHLFYAFILSP